MAEQWTAERQDVSLEKKIITAMIISKEFLRDIKPIYDTKFFLTPYAKIVSKWCMEFYLRFEKAPNRYIEDIYEDFKRGKAIREEEALLIGRFLSNLNKEYEMETKDFNVGYLIEQAKTYFKERNLRLLQEQLDFHLENGNLIKAQASIASFADVELPAINYCKPFVDYDVVASAFDDANDDLFIARGDLGELIGPFQRGFLVGIAAPYKRGKTWMLQELAIQAYMNKLNVAFISLEMTRRMMVQRLVQSAIALPVKSGKYLFPIWDCELNQNGSCTKSERINQTIIRTGRNKLTNFYDLREPYTPCTFCYPNKPYKTSHWAEERELPAMDWREAYKLNSALAETNTSEFLLECWPAFSAGVSDIKALMKVWETMNDFPIDVFVLDYADILKSENIRDAERHKLDRIWKELKSLAQEKNCLIITATQTNKSTLEKPSMKQGDVSEDSRKLAHVDVMIGINQTPEEKAMKVARVAVLAQRHEDFSVQGQCLIFQQLQVGQPCLDSRLV